MPHLDLCQLICSHLVGILNALTGNLVFAGAICIRNTIRLLTLEKSLAGIKAQLPEKCAKSLDDLLTQHNIQKQEKV